MSFIIRRDPKVSMPRNESTFHKNLTAEERAKLVALTSLREIPKSRYATHLAITQMPAGRGRKAIFSHIEVYKMVEGIANDLRETGVRPGTVCAMAVPNSIEAVVYFLALQWIGAIAAPIDEDLDVDSMSSVLKAVGATTLVSPLVEEDDRDDDPQYQKMESVAERLDLIHWNIYRSMNKGVQLEQHGRRAGKDAAWRGGAADFVLDPNEISVHIGSAGSGDSTSPRKGVALVVPLSHANLAASGKSFANTYELTPDQNVTVMAAPLHSIHSIVSLIGALYSGGHVVIPGQGVELTAPMFYQLAKENKVSWVSADADFIEALHDEAASNKSSLEGVSLAFVRCHEGNVSAESKSAFEANSRTILLESYGTAETGGLVTSNTEEDVRGGSSGKVAPGVNLAIFDPVTREKLPIGSSGDIGVCSPFCSKGYLGNDEATRATQVDVTNSDGSESTYVLTGNRGTVDEDGFLIVDGSSRDLRIQEMAAEEEVRSQRAVLMATEEQNKLEREAEEAAQKRERESRQAREAEEAEEAEEADRRERERAAERALKDREFEEREREEREREEKRKEREENENKSRSFMAAGMFGGAGNNGDPETMNKILERLMTIESNQKRMEEELKEKHALEMAEMQRLLEETQMQNRRAETNTNTSATLDGPEASPVLNVNMDEVNAAVNAASQAAQDSSRHTAEAAEAAKRAAEAAENAAASKATVVAAPMDLNASKVEVSDPNNVKKTVTVSLDEVEEAMMVHPAVGTCRAFGRPDPRYGAEIYCCVLPKKGARVSEPWLKLHAQSVLPAAFVPKKFYYREDLKADTERAELSEDTALKRISHLSGYSTTKMVKSPAWTPGDSKKAAA